MNSPVYHTFHGITVSIQAETAEEAYTKICNALDKLDGEWSTDTYTNNLTGVAEPTLGLYPDL